jgi:hypothetical protein
VAQRSEFRIGFWTHSSNPSSSFREVGSQRLEHAIRAIGDRVVWPHGGFKSAHGVPAAKRVVDDCGLRTGEDLTVFVTIPTDANWEFSLCNSAQWDTCMFVGTDVCASS